MHQAKYLTALQTWSRWCPDSLGVPLSASLGSLPVGQVRELLCSPTFQSFWLVHRRNSCGVHRIGEIDSSADGEQQKFLKLVVGAWENHLDLFGRLRKLNDLVSWFPYDLIFP